jgi:hypothetical protein
MFAFKDDSAEVVRVQVKACAAPKRFRDGSGYSARFTLPLKQLEAREETPPFYYAPAVLRDGRWSDFLVVSRESLQSHYDRGMPFGSRHETNEDLQITLEFRTNVTCSGRDLTDFRNAWTSLPPFRSTRVPPVAAQGDAADTGRRPVRPGGH